MQVRATARGYYGQLRKPGDRFVLADKEAFSSTWMEKIKAKAPEPEPVFVTPPDEPMTKAELKAEAKAEKAEAKAAADADAAELANLSRDA